MRKLHTDVPTWVRSFICIVASLAVFGLVLIASFGVEISGWLAWPVVVFAIQTASLAFGRDLSPNALLKLITPGVPRDSS